MEEVRRDSGSSFPLAVSFSNPDEADASSGDDDQSERSEASEFDPYDYNDIADRFYASEIEEIPSFRWMTRSQRQVGPSEAVRPDDESPGMLQRTPEGADRLRIEMDNLLARKRELESRIRQSPHRQPKLEVEGWLLEVESQCRKVDNLLNRRRSGLFYLGARFQLRSNVAKKLQTLGQLQLRIAEWGDDGRIFMQPVERSLYAQSVDEILQYTNLKQFASRDLRTATRNFSAENLLGKGGFGGVFKGWLDERSLMAARPGTGIPVAIKRHNLDGYQGMEEWLNEIKYLSWLYHPNIVRLIGYCMDDERHMLVYEFISRGSLDSHLFGRSSNSQQLTWNLRIKIALGAAKGLAFIHSLEPQVIRRDVKAADILLDMNYEAKLGDFGLARDGPGRDATDDTTRIMGTIGYIAPEYASTGFLSTRCDAYGFGVVLLELLTGRRSVDRNRPLVERSLVQWAKPFLRDQRRLSGVLDPSIGSQYPLSGAREYASLTLRCISSDPASRPSMDEVVSILDRLQTVQ